MSYRIIQTPNIRSFMALAVTAVVMWTFHVSYNSQSHGFPASTETSTTEVPITNRPTLRDATPLSNATGKASVAIELTANVTRATHESTSILPEVLTARTENKKPLATGARVRIPKTTMSFLPYTLPVATQTLPKAPFETSTANQTSRENAIDLSIPNGTDTTRLNQYPSSEHLATASAQNFTVFQRDFSREPSVLWPKDPNCSRYKLWFGLQVPSTWLLSFPRSGNTWTRYLLEAATGIVTGSVYHSKYLKGLGYMGEDDPLWWRTSLVIKTHSLLPLRVHPDYPVIAIIRNPARSILSFWNYWNIEADSQKFTGSIDYSYYLTPEFHEFVRIKLQKWRATYEYVLKNTTRLHVVFYEKIRENPIKEVRKMLRFLGVKTDEGRLACLSRHTEGRMKAAQKENDPYTLYEKMNMFSVVQAINALLKERGFTDLPDLEF